MNSPDGIAPGGMIDATCEFAEPIYFVYPAHMNTWIALLRGINVGGNRILPMKDLRALLEGMGYTRVRTYIQSGNCVFIADEPDANALAIHISNEIDQQFGFAPRVFCLNEAELKAALQSNPFDLPDDQSNKVLMFFLEREPLREDWDRLTELKQGREEIQRINSVAYIHAPDGIARSRMVEKVEKTLKIPATARNLRTVRKLKDMLDE